MQKLLDQAATNPHFIDFIINEIEDHFAQLLVDQYGNYFCQKLFDLINFQ